MVSIRVWFRDYLDTSCQRLIITGSKLVEAGKGWSEGWKHWPQCVCMLNSSYNGVVTRGMLAGQPWSEFDWSRERRRRGGGTSPRSQRWLCWGHHHWRTSHWDRCTRPKAKPASEVGRVGEPCTALNWRRRRRRGQINWTPSRERLARTHFRAFWDTVVLTITSPKATLDSQAVRGGGLIGSSPSRGGKSLKSCLFTPT